MSSLFIFYKKPNDSSIIPVVTLKIRYIFLTFFFLFNVMIMHFIMMEISTVCGLVKEQLFILALAYLLDLSLLLSPLTTFLIVTFPPSRQEVAKQQSGQTHWSYPSVFPLVLCLLLRYPILFLSTDIKIRHLRSKLNYHGVISVRIRKVFWCTFKMSPNEHSTYK